MGGLHFTDTPRDVHVGSLCFVPLAILIHAVGVTCHMSCVFIVVGEIAGDNGGSEFIWERDHEARMRLWKARHEWWYAGLAMQPGKKVSS